MYESGAEAPISRPRFLNRLAWHILIAFVILVASLMIGMAGYTYYEGFAWRDAFLNAAMVLVGMGAVNPPLTPDGKVFVGVYGLYAGLVFLIAIAVMLAPWFHRVMHRLHWDEE